ncbi:hypothetical protein ACHQM5_019435 [Ranunculus cassubicifolius]
MVKIWCIVVVILLSIINGESAIGVNWGTQATHELPPKTVVQMLKDNGINKVKLFDSAQNTMTALAGSGIEVMVAIPNDQLAAMTDYKRAQQWVRRNITRFNFNGGVNIKYVAVGNEPFLSAYNGSFIRTTLPALTNIQNALNEAGVGDIIKATVPLNADVYNSPVDNPVPSAGRFRPDISELMTEIVQFLNKNRAPFTINIYPFLSLYGNDDFPINYAFFDGGSNVIDSGSGVTYTNVFDANFDTLVWSLRAVGLGNLPIIVGEVGWPTDGDKNANLGYATRFYNGLLKRLAAKSGTPMRQENIDVYLFGLIDEDAKSIAPGNFERHWGIFRYDGQAKFPMDLSGQGQQRYLVSAKNVDYLEREWCVFNPRANDLTKLGDNINYACSLSDCTSLGYGSSCNTLDAQGNASYAFNMYFQAQSQAYGSCNFDGMAMRTTQNLSQGSCNFIIQIGSSYSLQPALLALLTIAVIDFFFTY